MNEIEIKIINCEHKEDINLINEPFTIFGRLIPTYDGENWNYTQEIFSKKSELRFPAENYDFDAMTNCIFIGAYMDSKCVGLAIIQQAFFKYMYLYDLKVNSDCRNKGIGTMLINKCKEIAVEQGYRGLYTQGQDNNLAACLFYLKNGFHIGGLDCDVYRGTSQENKRDVLFYTE